MQPITKESVADKVSLSDSVGLQMAVVKSIRDVHGAVGRMASLDAQEKNAMFLGTIAGMYAHALAEALTEDGVVLHNVLAEAVPNIKSRVMQLWSGDEQTE